MTQEYKLIDQSMLRGFIQPNGACWKTAVRFASKNFAHMELSGFTNIVRGDITREYHHGTRSGTWQAVQEIEEPPDTITGTVALRQFCGELPWLHQGRRCPFTIYEIVGKCADLDQLYKGWVSGYVRIYSELRITSIDGGDRTSFQGTDLITDTADATASKVYDIGSMVFYEDPNDGLIDSPVKDADYCSVEECGECGPPQSCGDRIYSIQEGPGRIVYSLEGGIAGSRILNNITTDTGDTYVSVRCVGSVLYAISKTLNGTGGYHYIPLDYNGHPDMTIGWTAISAGFVAGPNDTFVSDNGKMYFAGDSGYVYVMANRFGGVRNVFTGAGGLPNFNRIRGCGSNFLVVAGDGGELYYSDDAGENWKPSPTPTPTQTGLPANSFNAPNGTAPGNITALAVISRWKWWIGDDQGNLYATDDGGSTWSPPTPFQFYGAGTNPTPGAVIKDIDFSSIEVGHFVVSSPAGAVLWSTYTGGNEWTSEAPRLYDVPTLPEINNIQVPRCKNDERTNNNYLLIAGNDTFVSAYPNGDYSQF